MAAGLLPEKSHTIKELHIMVLNGFDKCWRDFPHYIVGITHQIWEERDLCSLHRYYDKHILLRSPHGVSIGNERVIADTMATLHEFPDRQLYGEDVIWCGTPQNENLLSSHRIFSTATHQGFGKFGKPSDRQVSFRTIADCAAKQNVIYDEWLVRDMGAIATQIGSSSFDYALALIEQEGGMENCKKPFSPDSDVCGKYIGTGNQNEWGELYATTITAIMNADLASIPRQYNRAIHASIPNARELHGVAALEQFWMGLRASFPSADFSIHHVIGRKDPNLPPRVAMRWSLHGKHDGFGPWGVPSGAEVYIFAISHAEFGPNNTIFRGIRREFTLYDEVAIWKQIHLHKG